MNTHLKGASKNSSDGDVPVVRGFQFSYNDIFPLQSLQILASPKNPTFVELWLDVLTPFAGGTTQIKVVTDQSVVLIDTADVDETAAGVQSPKTALFRQDATLSITNTHTGAAATAGVGILIARVQGLGVGAELKLK